MAELRKTREEVEAGRAQNIEAMKSWADIMGREALAVRKLARQYENFNPDNARQNLKGVLVDNIIMNFAIPEFMVEFAERMESLSGCTKREFDALSAASSEEEYLEDLEQRGLTAEANLAKDSDPEKP